jgi:hypothetical protein
MKRLTMQRLQLDRPTEATRRPTSGAACPCASCRGKLSVYATSVNIAAGLRTRYLACDVCGYKPKGNKRIIPLEYAPPQPSRSSVRPTDP